MREHCGWGSTWLHMGSTWAPRTRNVISWSQCVLSLQQTAGNFATLRHILLENHELVYVAVLRDGFYVAEQLALCSMALHYTSTVSQDPHCHFVVSVRAFGLPDGRHFGYFQAYFARKSRVGIRP